MQTRCPQCHFDITVAPKTHFTDISCPSCGISFSLVNDSTLTRPDDSCIGHFRLIRRLGTGQFGEVWQAQDTTLDRTVAIKIPRKGHVDSREAEQFFREARAAAQLKHPGIVAVHEVGRHDKQIYIVSDFVQGITLQQKLASTSALNPREAATLCAQIAHALHHAHEQGVIHRDVKPANIMLDGNNVPRVMDFGLAKREAGEITVTIEGQLLGTPAYMSPEQAQGSAHDADARSDVYSTGVILFEILTGELPFRGERHMLLHYVINEDAPSPRQFNKTIPFDLETICLVCLQKRPRDRYASAKALADDLERFAAGEPIHMRKRTVFHRLIHTISRGRVALDVFADWYRPLFVIAAILLTSGILTTWLRYTRSSLLLQFSPVVASVAALAVFFYVFWKRLGRAVTAAEQQLLLLIIFNYVAITFLDVVVIQAATESAFSWSFWTATPPSFDIATLVPYWMIVNGLLFHVMGTGYGGHFHAVGVSYFGLSVAVSRFPDAGLMAYALTWCAVIYFMARYFRRQCLS